MCMTKTNKDSKRKLKASHCLLHPVWHFKFILSDEHVLKHRNVNLNDQLDTLRIIQEYVHDQKQIRIQNES